MGVKTLTVNEVLARFGKALADPTRAAVLMRLKDGPAYSGDLADAIGVSKQVLSNHLACLRDCGLVVAESEGRRVRYELSDAKLAHALGDLLGVILSVEPVCLCAVPECPQ
ncbi:ArsR family transcriptional regulator [Arthrobacter terricola]|uniref:ArsR family transcriptional regulator n=1 Tax=Arthrobacter terricola TaxID=2547396 RepID=A0A4R5KKS7_9MICC|nr:ArsR family transcriptional regulator [Arthrobacter terricola]